jgi:hypothetical protein
LLGIYFYDPNGIRLEFACQPEDGEAPAGLPLRHQTKAEARAAVIEPSACWDEADQAPGGRARRHTPTFG